MKTLHAKGALILCLAFSGVPSVILILLGVNEFWEVDIDDGIFLVLCSILFILLGVFAGIKIYCTHRIQYGNGRVVIKRVSKELINGRPVGKWKKREDIFLIEEIDAYGLSWQVLGHYVEYHRSSARSLTTECFFQMKDGRQVGFEMVYYTKKLQELFDYIYDETGVEFKSK